MEGPGLADWREPLTVEKVESGPVGSDEQLPRTGPEDLASNLASQTVRPVE